ncbi:hypothetical protein ACFYXM_19100 [Streptomyces sp. NPDC002476]|uniref:hypothetical protein n=1 Tax=Streptomyces sp. NPDC002476 TaxID=3364648 RepID=UPI0036C96162
MSRPQPHREHWTYCGFVRDRDTAARTAPAARPADGEVTVCREDGTPGVASVLEEAWRGHRHELTTGLAVRGVFNFETLQVCAATTPAGFCRPTVPSAAPGNVCPVAPPGTLARGVGQKPT